MKSRRGYMGYVIEARSCERRDGGFSAEFRRGLHALGAWVQLKFAPGFVSDTRPMS